MTKVEGEEQRKESSSGRMNHLKIRKKKRLVMEINQKHR